MKALIKEARSYGSISVKEVEKRKLRDQEDILIQVKAAGVCGTDVHSYEYIESSRHMQVPVILGHEFSGEVIAVGNKVNDFKIGDRVMGESNLNCGECVNCRQGHGNICTQSLMQGVTTDGTMAEIVALNQRFVHHIPDNTDYNSAAVAQPMSVCIHGVFDKCNITPGDTVVVFGPGIMGLISAQLAKIKGAGQVYITGTEADAEIRLPAASRLGIKIVNTQRDSLEQIILDDTKSNKVDVCIECSGSPQALIQAGDIVKKGGYLTILGIYAHPITIDITTLVRKEVKIRTSYTSTWKDYERALKLLDLKLLTIEGLYKEYSLDDAELAFQDALNKKVLKPILKFN